MSGYYKSNLRQCHRIIIKCPCGSSFQKVHTKNHFLTDLHQNFLNGTPDKITFLTHPWKFFSCSCGYNVLRRGMIRHLRSKRHKKLSKH